MNRSIVAALCVTVLGSGVLTWGTDGFNAFTDEGARRYAVQQEPRPVPDAVFQDQSGRRFDFTDLRGRVVAVEFIYVNCPTVCSTLGQAFRRVHDALPAALRGRDVVLLSVSFDPRRDVPSRLADYAQRHGADGTAWRVVRIEDRTALQAWLRAFGIVVIDDGLGGFEHNAALHLVDRAGRLARIEDFDRPLAFATHIEASL